MNMFETMRSNGQGSPEAEALPLTQTKALEAIRAALLMLVLLTTAAAAVSWDRLRNLPHGVELIPLLLFVVICTFVILVYRKAREMAGLRGAVQTLQSQQSALASELEVQKLLQVVAASRESFRDLVDSFDSAVFTLSLDGKVRAANKAFVGIFDRPFSEVIGSSIFELISEPSASQLQAALPTFMEKRHWSGLVRACISATGQWKFFDCTLHPVLQDDTVLAATIVATDVTAERERESTFSALFDTLHEPVWISTCEGRLLNSNRAMTALAGADGEQLLNGNLLELVLEPERLQMADAMRARRTITDLELTLVRADGTRAFCIANATPVIEVSGAARYHGTFTDITHRRSIERKLACEQKFREQLIASFPDAILTLDAAGSITFVSGGAERVFGKSANSLRDASLRDFVDPQDEFALHTFLHDCLSLPGTVCTRELRLSSSNAKSWRTIQASGTALQDDESKTLGVVASMRDISEEKRIEQHLVTVDRMAAVGQMVGGVAHELNNALTAMLGACALMRDISAPPDTQKHFELLDGQAKRVGEILKNLLLSAQPTAAGVTAVNVRDLIDRAAALRQHSLRTKNIFIEVQAATNAPAVIGNPAQLMQVFRNLLLSAERESLARENGPRTIRISIDVLTDFVCCTVEPHDGGVDQQVSKRFVPIADGREHDDMDLGVKISQAIINAHGGKMDVCEQRGIGTAIRISLPAFVQMTCTESHSVPSEAQGKSSLVDCRSNPQE
jgi:PAS domain S-box-containing protein